MPVCPVRRVVEDDLVRLPVDRTEVGLAHLPGRRPPGLDLGLVHGDHGALQDVRGLGLGNRLEQFPRAPPLDDNGNVSEWRVYSYEGVSTLIVKGTPGSFNYARAILRLSQMKMELGRR